jgi:5'-deoxynucleotidase YfbR-like HD superfamily hydrolase
MRLAGLLHDATEAYLGDVTTPLKRSPAMAPYRELERAWARAIGERFDVDLVNLPQAVLDADLRALVTEKRDLLEPTGVPMAERYGRERVFPEPWDFEVTPRDPLHARLTFMATFRTCRRGWTS